MNKKYFIIWVSIVACFLMFLIEQVFEVPYLVKTISKIILFISIPIYYIKRVEDNNLRDGFNLKVDKQRLRLGFLFGVISFLVIILAFYLCRELIDLNHIASEMREKANITPSIFVFVAIYVVFGNSLLEEFFFRGFIFLNLYRKGYRFLAYIFSSFLFALYHIAIFATWFSLPILLLCLFGLVSVGFIFNWLNTKSDNFLNSWIVHIFADIAIIIIGFKMFGFF